MRKTSGLLTVLILVGACGFTQGGDSDAPTEGLYAAAVDFVRGQGDYLAGKDLVYVVQPGLSNWSSWCLNGYYARVKAIDDFCAEVDFVDGISSGFTSEEWTELEAALTPASVLLVDDLDSVLEPMAEDVMMAPVKDDTGFLTFGVPVFESGAKAYLPVASDGEGWLLGATRGSEGWTFQVVAFWVA